MQPSNKFSIIIPTYKAVEYLDMCLKSLTQFDTSSFEIIVICDGHFELYKELLEQYNWHFDLKVLKFEKNRGMPTALNFGVYSAKYDTIFIVNDDNIFPSNFIKVVTNLLETKFNNFCISFPQIEPISSSIFNKFLQIDLGKTFDTFDIDKFNEICKNFSTEITLSKHLGTFPFLINKKLYMTVGGFDVDYQSAFVTDWDFFIKVSNIVDLEIVDNCNFYHFKSITSDIKDFKDTEIDAHHFFKFKWGRYGGINHDQTSYLE
jgi:glycosyltransferase involved in cell wall biosynthesis